MKSAFLHMTNQNLMRTFGSHTTGLRHRKIMLSATTKRIVYTWNGMLCVLCILLYPTGGMDASSPLPPSASFSEGDTSQNVPSLFDRLPESSLVCIFSFVITHPRDVRDLALVCRTWETATLSNVLWKSLLPLEYPTLCAVAKSGPVDTADLRTVFKLLLQGFLLDLGQVHVKMEFQNFAKLVYCVRMDENWLSQYCQVVPDMPGSMFGRTIGIPSGIYWMARGEELMLPAGEYSVSWRMSESRPKIVAYVADWARYPTAHCTYLGHVTKNKTNVQIELQNDEESEGVQSEKEKVDLSKVAYFPKWSELHLGDGILTGKGSPVLGYERAYMHLKVHSGYLLARAWLFDCLVYRKLYTSK